MQALPAALSAGSMIVGAVGDSQAQGFQASQARVRAQQGRIQAIQTDTAYRDELNSSQALVNAIRASAGVNMDSPTGLAINAQNQRVSDRDRTRDVANRNMQATQDEADAAFLDRSRKWTLLGGFAKGAVPLAGLMG